MGGAADALWVEHQAQGLSARWRLRPLTGEGLVRNVTQ